MRTACRTGLSRLSSSAKPAASCKTCPACVGICHSSGHSMDDLGSPLGQEKGRRALRRRHLPCNCRFVGPVPLHSTFSLIGTTCCRPTPLHAGMANPYQGRLRLRNLLDPTIPWFSCRYSPITPRKFKLIPSVSQRHVDLRWNES